MIADVFVGIQSTFSLMITATSALGGMFLTVIGLLIIHKSAVEASSQQSMSVGVSYIIGGVLLFTIPSIMLDVNEGLDGADSSSYVQVSKPSEQVVAVSTPVVKTPSVPVKQYQPLIPKSEYKPVADKPVDYSRLGIVLGSVFGGLIGAVLSVVGLVKLRKKLRIRKYQKIVSGVVDLNNDFITLSAHIETIDNYLHDIKKYRLGASDETKSLLDSMLNVLEHKKQVFNKTVKEIHETQPELKVLGGLS